MANISFEWDEGKRDLKEDRVILLGLSSKLRILVVCHCYRKNDEVIRIISVRKATRSEQKQYWKRW